MHTTYFNCLLFRYQLFFVCTQCCFNYAFIFGWKNADCSGYEPEIVPQSQSKIVFEWRPEGLFRFPTSFYARKQPLQQYMHFSHNWILLASTNTVYQFTCRLSLFYFFLTQTQHFSCVIADFRRSGRSDPLHDPLPWSTKQLPQITCTSNRPYWPVPHSIVSDDILWQVRSVVSWYYVSVVDMVLERTWRMSSIYCSCCPWMCE